MVAATGLAARGLRKVFHPGSADERIALDAVNLDLAPGDFAVVIGSNEIGRAHV